MRSRVPESPTEARALAGLAGTAALGEVARGAGLRRVAILAWRDVDDAEAGGSELHAHEVASRWAAAGIDVVVRTSSVAGRTVLLERAGYRVIRRSRQAGAGRWTGSSRSGTACRF